MSDLEKQVAEVRCQEQHYDYRIPGQMTTIACGEGDNDCTGLRWPGLSQEGKCPCGSASCHAPRVPDVTLGKVLVPEMVVSIWYDSKSFAEPTWVALTWDALLSPGFGNTPKEAAMAALLAS